MLVKEEPEPGEEDDVRKTEDQPINLSRDVSNNKVRLLLLLFIHALECI